jgi:hypothetical protein
MMFNLRLERFMILPNPLHQIFEELMSRRTLLIGIHHLNQSFFIFVLTYKLSPACFVVNLTRTHSFME